MWKIDRTGFSKKSLGGLHIEKITIFRVFLQLVGLYSKTALTIFFILPMEIKYGVTDQLTKVSASKKDYY